MNPQTKKAIKITAVVELMSSVILLIVAFFIQGIPENKLYYYRNNQITSSSWHNVFEYFPCGLFLALLTLSAALTIICIVGRIKTKQKVKKHLLIIWGSEIVCFLIIMLRYVLVMGIWSDEDYFPICYEFTDGQHTIVIEEESFLLYGGGTIYQINDDNEAVILNVFTTDDGGRNNGNYDISWYDDYAEITYHTFNTKDSMSTIKIIYAD